MWETFIHKWPNHFFKRYLAVWVLLKAANLLERRRYITHLSLLIFIFLVAFCSSYYIFLANLFSLLTVCCWSLSSHPMDSFTILTEDMLLWQYYLSMGGICEYFIYFFNFVFPSLPWPVQFLIFYLYYLQIWAAYQSELGIRQCSERGYIR